MDRSPMRGARHLEMSTTKTEVNADGKALVTLRFVGDALDPDEISALLPVKPTRAHRKGEEFFAGRRAGNLRGRTGMWFLATDKLVPSENLQEHLLSFRSYFVRRLAMPTGSTSSATSCSERTPAPASPAFGAALPANRPHGSRSASNPPFSPWPPT